MRDLSYSMNAAWLVVTTLMYATGALGVVLLDKQAKTDIALIIFTIFEWLSAILSTIYLIPFFPSANYLSFIIQALNAFCAAASTAIGIYWIDNIILESVTTKSLYLRQLKVCFITLFTVSLLFKFVIYISAFLDSSVTETNRKEIPNVQDLEANIEVADKESTKFGSVLSDSIASSKFNVVKIKDSLQTLVSKQGNNNLNDYKDNSAKASESRINEPGFDYRSQERLNLKYAELFKLPSTSETIETSDLHNSTPNMLFEQKPLTGASFKQSQILVQNNYIQDIPSTPMMTNLSNHITEEDLEESMESVLVKSPHYQFPQDGSLTSPYKSHHPNYNFILERPALVKNVDEDKNIQALNISEPIYGSNLATKLTSNGKTLHNISLQTWNEKSKLFLQNNDFVTDNIHLPQRASDINHFGSSMSFSENFNAENEALDTHSNNSEYNNCLLEELNREIKENGSHHAKIQMQQSLPNLKLASRHSSQLNRGDSVSKIMGLKPLNQKSRTNSSSLNFAHQKSSSLSAIPMSKSRSHSPLKKFKDFRDSIQLTPRTPKQTRPPSPITSNEFELDLHIANSIRKSPGKKLSSKSLNSKTGSRKISLSSPIRPNTNVSMLDVESYYPTGIGYDLNLSPGEGCVRVLGNAENESPSDKQNYFTHVVDDYIIQNIVKSQRVFSGVSGMSGTDKSTTSNASVPSGYYGEYDKEKWRVIKKVKNGVIEEANKTLDFSCHGLPGP